MSLLHQSKEFLLTLLLQWLHFIVISTYRCSCALFELCNDVFIKWQKPSRVALGRIPKHIAFAIQSSYFSCLQIAQLLYWCGELHISHISLYDPSGELIQKAKQIHSILCELDGDLNVTFESHSFQICSEFGQQSEGKKVHTEKLSMLVRLLSLTDSRSGLVNVACQLGRTFSNDKSSYYRLDFNQIQSILFPDSPTMGEPELLLCFCTTHSLLEFPPWLIRTSEIRFETELGNMNKERFYAHLHCFAKTEQRWGT